MWVAPAFLLSVGCSFHLIHNASAFGVQKKKRVVIIGGGWAGFSAADALATAPADAVEVVLLDAAEVEPDVDVLQRYRLLLRPLLDLEVGHG